MKVRLTVSTNRSDSQVTDAFDLEKLTGCNKDEWQELDSETQDDLLCDAWIDMLDIEKLTGYSGEDWQELNADEQEKLLCDVWLDWRLENTDGGEERF